MRCFRFFFSIFGCSAYFKGEFRRNGWRQTMTLCKQELLKLSCVSWALLKLLVFCMPITVVAQWLSYSEDGLADGSTVCAQPVLCENTPGPRSIHHVDRRCSAGSVVRDLPCDGVLSCRGCRDVGLGCSPRCHLAVSLRQLAGECLSDGSESGGLWLDGAGRDGGRWLAILWALSDSLPTAYTPLSCLWRLRAQAWSSLLVCWDVRWSC